MSRIVTTALLDPATRRLHAAPADEVDPVVRELVQRAADEAYERGVAAGREAGEAAAREAVAEHDRALTAALAESVDEVRAASVAQRQEELTAAVDLAMAIAAAVIGHEPHDGGAAVAARVQEILDAMADPDLVVLVHPGDQATVAAAVARRRDVTVEPDPSLQPGEARIRGTWADAELTRAAAFEAVRGGLHVDG